MMNPQPKLPPAHPALHGPQLVLEPPRHSSAAGASRRLNPVARELGWDVPWTP